MPPCSSHNLPACTRHGLRHPSCRAQPDASWSSTQVFRPNAFHTLVSLKSSVRLVGTPFRKDLRRSACIGRPPWALNVFTLEKTQRRVRLARLFELLRLLRGCGRSACGCRCLVVGKFAVVPIVLGVDEAGVREVSGKDREAKQSERRGLCRAARGTTWSPCSWLQGTLEADRKFLSETVRVVGFSKIVARVNMRGGHIVQTQRRQVSGTESGRSDPMAR